MPQSQHAVGIREADKGCVLRTRSALGSGGVVDSAVPNLWPDKSAAFRRGNRWGCPPGSWRAGTRVVSCVGLCRWRRERLPAQGS